MYYKIMGIFDPKEPIISLVTAGNGQTVTGWYNVVIIPIGISSFTLTFQNGNVLNMSTAIGFGFGGDVQNPNTQWGPLRVDVVSGSVEIIVNGDVVI
jgi:hypothetical protein